MNAPAAGQEGPLALICGAGSLPLAVADLVAARGRQVLLFPLQGIARPEDYATRPHTWIRIAQTGPFERAVRASGCKEVVLIGALVRPSIWQLRLNWTTLRLLPRIAAAYRGGDDHLLSGVAKLIEERGLSLRGAHEVAPEILVPKGTLGRVQPTEHDRADIALGLEYLRVTGPFDVGQAVVVAGRHVLAVEAAEGTDEMIARVAELRANGRIRAATRGVLIKAPKRGQDRRFDLPSIGPRTVEGIARAGLAGIAVAAGGTIIADAEQLVQSADNVKIFIVGVAAGSEP